jgi:hypothetical protein
MMLALKVAARFLASSVYPDTMKTFKLLRKEDATGISGTGIVAEGVQFSNGKCALSWLTEFTSMAIYDDIGTLEKIHGHGGKTVIEWDK